MLESVLESYAVGALGVAAIAVGWLAVQLAWRRSFPEVAEERDALASRSCAGCGHSDHCEGRLVDEGDAS